MLRELFILPLYLSVVPSTGGNTQVNFYTQDNFINYGFVSYSDYGEYMYGLELYYNFEGVFDVNQDSSINYIKIEKVNISFIPYSFDPADGEAYQYFSDYQYSSIDIPLDDPIYYFEEDFDKSLFYVESIFNIRGSHLDMCYYTFDFYFKQNVDNVYVEKLVEFDYTISDYDYIEVPEDSYINPLTINYTNYNGRFITYQDDFTIPLSNKEFLISPNKGYIDGYNVGLVNGKEQGYNNGYNDGYSIGFDAGFEADSSAITIFNGILNVAMVPINFFLNIFNFNILGINMKGLVSALLTICIIIIVIRLITGKKE